jgi:hypothetical protein
MLAKVYSIKNEQNRRIRAKRRWQLLCAVLVFIIIIQNVYIFLES